MNRFLILTLIFIVLLAFGFLAWAMGGTRASELSVISDPPRSSVWMDGRFLGATPIQRADLLPGRHVLRIARYGHRAIVREVLLAAGPNIEKFSLTPLLGGTLTVKTDPPGAEVSLDGESAGLTPLTLKGLSPGGHPVRLSLVNYIDWTGTASIEESRTASIEATLKARTEELYLEEMKRKPNDAAPVTDLGHYYILRGEWTKAEECFAKALVLCAREGDSSYYVSRLYQEIDKVFRSQFNYNDLPRGQQAIVNAFALAVKEVPTYTTYYGMGLGYAHERGLIDKGQEIIETGVVAVPYDFSWTTQTIQRRWGDGSPDRWIERLTSELKKDPEDFVARFQRAVLYSQKGDSANAVADYELVAKKAKSPAAQAKFFESCGRLYERLKEYDKAAASYSAALKIEPVKKNRMPVLYNLARALTRAANRPDDAHAAWRDAVAAQEDVETACRWRLEWAQMNVAAGKLDRARETLDETIRLTRDDNTRSRAKDLLKETAPK